MFKKILENSIFHILEIWLHGNISSVKKHLCTKKLGLIIQNLWENGEKVAKIANFDTTTLGARQIWLRQKFKIPLPTFF